MWDIKCLVYDATHSKSLQQFINHRFSDSSKTILSLKDFEYITLKNGDMFYSNRDCDLVIDIPKLYKFDDIHKDDIVIDIGANIGGFAIPASRLSHHVFAVEPILTKELIRNIELNNRDISVINGALGNGFAPKVVDAPEVGALLQKSDFMDGRSYAFCLMCFQWGEVMGGDL